jgi:hypothetical protein
MRAKLNLSGILTTELHASRITPKTVNRFLDILRKDPQVVNICSVTRLVEDAAASQMGRSDSDYGDDGTPQDATCSIIHTASYAPRRYYFQEFDFHSFFYYRTLFLFPKIQTKRNRSVETWKEGMLK